MKHSLLQKSAQALKVRFQLDAEDLGQIPASPVPEWYTRQMQRAVGEFIRSEACQPCKEPILKLLSQTPRSIDFTCDIELFPAVTLPASCKQTIDVPELQAPDESELTQALETLQLQHSDLSPVKRPAQWGDLLILEMVGTCQNRLIPQSVQTDWQVVLKASEPADPFLSQLLGLSRGQQKVLTQPLPPDYPYLPWRKLPANYVVYVEQVLEVRVPPLTDVLAQVSGLARTFDDLLSVLYEQVREQKRQAWLNQIREQVVQNLVAASQVQIPPSWEEAETRSQWESTDAIALKALRHIKSSQALLAQGWQSWQSHTHLRKQQAEALKTRLVLQEIALKEGLALTGRQREAAFASLAAGLSVSPEQLNRSLAEANTLQTLEGQLLLDKVARWLVQQAQLRCKGQMLT